MDHRWKDCDTMSRNISGRTPDTFAVLEHNTATITDGTQTKVIRKTRNPLNVFAEQGVITELEPLCYKPTQYNYEGQHIECGGITAVSDIEVGDAVIVFFIGEWRYALKLENSGDTVRI